jgi:hypothetical protein
MESYIATNAPDAAARIERAARRTPPSPIRFTAVFSEPVSDFGNAEGQGTVNGVTGYDVLLTASLSGGPSTRKTKQSRPASGTT